jgi:hypothetical protein
MGKIRKAHKFLVGTPEGNRLLGRPTRAWEDNIKMDIKDIGVRVLTGSIWLRIATGGGLL